ncbi:calcium-binding protein [Rhodobacteraceae bacterium LMO-12]|nr:calcium-binding protein [Rhodobacteraceae bacterium LMO-JJ12]
MNRKTLFAATVLTVAAIGGAAFADSHHGHKGQSGPNDRSGMMMQDGGSGMMGKMDGMSGMMQRMHGNKMGGGMMGGMGHMGGVMMQMFDADGDGKVTPQEMREQMQTKLTEYDSDSDGTLSISEFETLHSAMIREMMVDRFQQLDADGDGKITSDEMTAPADKMERMQKMRASQGKMQGQPGQGMGMGDGAKMNDN